MADLARKKSLLLETTKKKNSALARKKYKTAYDLLQVKNSLRADLRQPPFILKNLKSRL